MFEGREQNRFKHLLRSYVGRGGIPVEMAAELTGISERRIYSHIAADGSLPNSDDMLAYIRLLGPDFLNHWTQVVGITGAHRASTVEGNVFETTLHAVTRTTELLRVFAEAVDDGRIDHRERLSVPGHILGATSYLNAVAVSYGELRA